MMSSRIESTESKPSSNIEDRMWYQTELKMEMNTSLKRQRYDGKKSYLTACLSWKEPSSSFLHIRKADSSFSRPLSVSSCTEEEGPGGVFALSRPLGFVHVMSPAYGNGLYGRSVSDTIINVMRVSVQALRFQSVTRMITGIPMMIHDKEREREKKKGQIVIL